MHMEIKDWASLGSLIISLAALFYAYRSNIKRYEIASTYRAQIRDWFGTTVRTLTGLKHSLLVDPAKKDPQFSALLASLSAQIEVGRLFFPNIETGDGFGEEKPNAYRGYRSVVLDFLVHSYNLYSRPDASKYLHHADILQRYFTSYVFAAYDPDEHLSRTKELTKRDFKNDFTIETFIQEKPEAFGSLFFK